MKSRIFRFIVAEGQAMGEDLHPAFPFLRRWPIVVLSWSVLSALLAVVSIAIIFFILIAMDVTPDDLHLDDAEINILILAPAIASATLVILWWRKRIALYYAIAPYLALAAFVAVVIQLQHRGHAFTEPTSQQQFEHAREMDRSATCADIRAGKRFPAFDFERSCLEKQPAVPRK